MGTATYIRIDIATETTITPSKKVRTSSKNTGTGLTSATKASAVRETLARGSIACAPIATPSHSVCYTTPEGVCDCSNGSHPPRYGNGQCCIAINYGTQYCNDSPRPTAGQSSCYTVYPSTPVPSTTERIATTKKPSPTITLTTKRPKNHPDVQFTSEGSVAIWYFVDTGCYGDPTICSQTFNVYSVTKGKDPSDVCSGWDGSANYHHPNIDFELPQLPGGSVDFIYSRSGEHDPGFVKGDGIPSSVSCSAAPSPTASQECAYEIDTNFGDKVKRVGGPPPPAVRVAYEGYHWSSCDWGLGELPPGR